MTKTQLQIAFSEAAMSPMPGKIVLTCILILTAPMAAWCQQPTKEQFNLTPDAQNAITLRAALEEKKAT
jgi:hypothetical protein